MKNLQDNSERTVVHYTPTDGESMVEIVDTVKGRPALSSLLIADVLRVLIMGMGSVAVKIYETEFNSIYTRFKRAKAHIQKLRELGLGYDVDAYHDWITENNQKSQLARGVKPKKAKQVLKSFSEPEIQDAIMKIDRITKRKIEEVGTTDSICLIKAVEAQNEGDGIDLAPCDILHRFGSVTIPIEKYKRVQCDWITKYKDKNAPKKFLRMEIPNRPGMIRIALVEREQYQLMQSLANLRSMNPSEETIEKYIQLRMDQMPVRVPLAYDHKGNPDFEKSNELIKSHKKLQTTTN